MALDTDDLELKDLGNFYGTQEYHQGFLGVLLTDGVAYISNNGYSWFVTDAISVIRTKLKDEEFLSIKLILLDGSRAKMVITDGNDKTLYEQDYLYTDAKRSLNLFYTDNVLMLSGEY